MWYYCVFFPFYITFNTIMVSNYYNYVTLLYTITSVCNVYCTEIHFKHMLSLCKNLITEKIAYIRQH